MTPERLARLKQVLNTRQPDLSVLTDQVHKPRNLSAIMRSCDDRNLPYPPIDHETGELIDGVGWMQKVRVQRANRVRWSEESAELKV